MERLRAPDLRAVLATLEAMASLEPLGDFPVAALAAVERLVPCDHCGYNEVDPEQRQARVVIDPPELALPALEQAFAEHAHEHPILKHIQRTGEVMPAKISDFVSQRQFHHLSLYDLVYRHLRTEYQIVFELMLSPVVALALNRSGPDFSERDRAVLEALRPHLRRAYLTAGAVGRLGEAVDQGGRAAVVVNRDGAVQTITEQALRWLAAYYPGEIGGEILPGAMTCWLRRRQAFRQLEDDLPLPLDPLVVHGDGTRLVVTFVAGATPAEPDLLLLEERQEASTRRLGLSAREAEIMERLAKGMTDAEIAEALVVSTRTVQAHLQRIDRKLGVSHRTAALARIADAGGSPPP